MTLIVSKKANGGYHGKHKAKATALVKAGIRVGFVWVGAGSTMFFCHICKKDQPLPVSAIAFEQAEKVDEFAECGGCQTPFVFAEF